MNFILDRRMVLYMECKFCGANIKIKRHIFLGIKYKYKCQECGKEINFHDYPDINSCLAKLENTAYIVYCFTLLPLSNVIRCLLNIDFVISFFISMVAVLSVSGVICSCVYCHIIKKHSEPF